eukprot:scaffold61646_cov62-Phaeocystis_antarctica.AAC.6
MDKVERSLLGERGVWGGSREGWQAGSDQQPSRFRDKEFYFLHARHCNLACPQFAHSAQRAGRSAGAGASHALYVVRQPRRRSSANASGMRNSSASSRLRCSSSAATSALAAASGSAA